jgi:hypothetical protein
VGEGEGIEIPGGGQDQKEDVVLYFPDYKVVRGRWMMMMMMMMIMMIMMLTTSDRVLEYFALA